MLIDKEVTILHFTLPALSSYQTVTSTHLSIMTRHSICYIWWFKTTSKEPLLSKQNQIDIAMTLSGFT